MEKNEELQYESFEEYELPSRTQFSMLKKPAVSIKYGQLTFNMAAIRLFEGVKHVLTVVNTEKKRMLQELRQEQQFLDTCSVVEVRHVRTEYMLLQWELWQSTFFARERQTVL